MIFGLLIPSRTRRFFGETFIILAIETNTNIPHVISLIYRMTYEAELPSIDSVSRLNQ